MRKNNEKYKFINKYVTNNYGMFKLMIFLKYSYIFVSIKNNNFSVLNSSNLLYYHSVM